MVEETAMKLECREVAGAVKNRLAPKLSLSLFIFVFVFLNRSR
jgi:hypothetical protein